MFGVQQVSDGNGGTIKVIPIGMHWTILSTVSGAFLAIIVSMASWMISASHERAVMAREIMEKVEARFETHEQTPHTNVEDRLDNIEDRVLVLEQAR